MSWFLDRFRAVRELRDEVRQLRLQLRQAGDSAIDLGDKVRDQAAEIARLSGELAEARKETVHSVQCVADWMSQMQYGTRIYTPAPILPATPPPEIIIRKAQARRAVEEAVREFFAKYDEQFRESA